MAVAEFSGYSIHHDTVSIKNRGGGRGCEMVNNQSLLCLAKVICWQPLNPKNQLLHNSKAVSLNDPINTIHRQISLSATDLINSKLVSLGKTLSFCYFTKSAREPKEKVYLWNIHDIFMPHTTLEFSILNEQHIYLWTNISTYISFSLFEAWERPFLVLANVFSPFQMKVSISGKRMF